MRRRTGLGLLWLSSVVLAASSGCAGTSERTASVAKSVRDAFRPDARYVAARKAKEAEEQDSETTRIKDPSELNLAYARWMEDVGNLIEARRHYGEVLDNKPKNLDAVLGLARIDQLSGRTQEAEQGFLKALRHAPDSSEALHALGQFYASQERWPDAVDTLNKAMLAAPSEKLCRYHLAVALVHVGDINGAMPHFIRTVGDAEAHYNVGLILRDQGKLKDAEQQFLLAVTKKPELHQAQYWLDELRREQEAAQLVAQGAGPVPPIRPAAHQQLQVPSSTVTSNGRHSVGGSRPVTPPPSQLTPQQLEQLQNQRPAGR